MGGNQTRYKLHCLWLDPKISNKENQYYLKQLQNTGIEVTPYEKTETFFEALEDMLPPSPKVVEPVIAIVSASLDEQTYQAINVNPKVKYMVLFCGYYPNACKLRSKFRKIAAICLESEVLKRTLGYWEHFDQPNEILPVSLKKLLDRETPMKVDLTNIKMDLYD